MTIPTGSLVFVCGLDFFIDDPSVQRRKTARLPARTVADSRRAARCRSPWAFAPEMPGFPILYPLVVQGDGAVRHRRLGDDRAQMKRGEPTHACRFATV